jgi:hypothetical protein
MPPFGAFRIQQLFGVSGLGLSILETSWQRLLFWFVG